MSNAEALCKDLPDAGSALRFLRQFEEDHPRVFAQLKRNDALLSDVLALASFSPLLSTTLLQHPEYVSWLGRRRTTVGVRGKEQLLESLARFALTNSTVGANVLLARFRRRELLRIFLMDIRRLATVAEITEELSNLADAILENALRLARQELDNKYGRPEETDEKGRIRAAEFCIVSLGKLGSLELNYSSDIDLLFIYSAEGKTSGNGSRGSITNHEYFVKLGEAIRKTIDSPGGEGSAYRVDMRLRPHGRVGALALSLADTVRYYNGEAHAWERQVLIRSRASAGDAMLFRKFWDAVSASVFAADIPVGEALAGVLRSKQQIDLEQARRRGFNVKLGIGGIREIEFIAQALQLAYGGSDPWLRVPHTLISLTRLADRRLLSETELTELAAAYEFLRRTEHILQMENGLQVHTVPDDTAKRALLAQKMGLDGAEAFTEKLGSTAASVNEIFRSIFDVEEISQLSTDIAHAPDPAAELLTPAEPDDEASGFERYSRVSKLFREQIAAVPEFDLGDAFLTDDGERDLRKIIIEPVRNTDGFRARLNVLRKNWHREMLRLIVADIDGTIGLSEIKKRQNALAEASIEAALDAAEREMERRMNTTFGELPIALLGLGKLGGGGVDYGSDLDLVIVYDERPIGLPDDMTAAEFYNRLVELFVNALSAMTRYGSLYRVDLRLRPYGKDGATAIPQSVFLEYVRENAAIWELLAYVKIRAAGGDAELGRDAENEIRAAIHERAKTIDPNELAAETFEIRRRLQRQKAVARRTGDIDIKYGEGGMLDIYFAIRFLQLRDGVPDTGDDRSSSFMLRELHAAGSLPDDAFDVFRDGYDLLSRLDHTLRLTVGRSTRLPLSNTEAMNAIAERMGFKTVEDLLQNIAVHRMNIRAVFEEIVTS
jgi:glutamate-ammonia-ligase adenylyltransferase